jgi:hypothetical protein
VKDCFPEKPGQAVVPPHNDDRFLESVNGGPVEEPDQMSPKTSRLLVPIFIGKLNVTNSN